MMGCTEFRNGAAAALLLALTILTGCAAPKDAHIPDFARVPYEPFSRDAAVAIAIREWRAFGAPITDEEAPLTVSVPEGQYSAERAQGLWQRVGEYWWLGLNADQRGRARTGKHDEHGHEFSSENDTPYAWSAVFISYVMRMAGAGLAFPYSAAHFDYINEARRASLGQVPARRVWAERIEDYAPRLGDLICMGRGRDRNLRFDNLPVTIAATHCDIVVGIEPDRLSVIGGNVDDAVALSFVPTTADGKLGDAAGPLDPNYPWFVVVKVLYER
jgi:hypothetical protein